MSREDRTLTMAGVLLSLMLAAIDQTIVSTAGPAIQRDLRIEPALYAWITTAYLVASTVMLPIYGKLSDRLGRKPILLTGVGLFLLGSFLCGMAPSAIPLIAFRGIQGLGAAALFTTTFAVIADLFPPAVRGRYMGLVSAVMGIASVIGPLVGGFLTDTLSWHWVFYVNLPVGAVALWFIIARMPSFGASPSARAHPIDIAGAVWLILGLVPLLVALSLGRGAGSEGDGGWAWSSWQILAMLGISLASLAAFVVTERRAADPILHFELFRDRVIGLSTAAVFVLGAGFLFGVIFLPLYLVNVVGVSATRAGLTMMPLTLGIVIGSVAAGQLVSRIGHYRRLLIASLSLMLASFALMGFTLSPDGGARDVTLKMLLIGLGTGPTLPLYTLAMQNAARHGEVGVVTAAATFSRSLGQVIGLAIFGTLFATLLTSRLASGSREVLASLPPEARPLVAATTPVLSGGGESGATIAFDTAAAKRQIRSAMGAASGAISGAVGTTASDAPADSTSAALLERAAVAGVDALARVFRVALTDAVSSLYRIGMIFVAAALLVTILIPERPLQQYSSRSSTPSEPI